MKRSEGCVYNLWKLDQIALLGQVHVPRLPAFVQHAIPPCTIKATQVFSVEAILSNSTFHALDALIWVCAGEDAAKDFILPRHYSTNG